MHTPKQSFGIKGMMYLKNETLKQVRRESAKTQLQLAKETELNVRTYQKYENGMGANTIQTAIRIAKALNTTVEHLWGNTPFRAL